MRVLIVGAGAIGLAWAWHFARGGATVTFLVRERYVDATSAPIALLPHGAREVVYLREHRVTADPGDAASADLIVLAMPSTGFDAGQLATLHAAAPREAVVLSLLPGPEDHARVAAAMPGRTVLAGLLALSSWQSPLPGTNAPEATAWWFPPLSRCDIGGDDNAAQRVVQVLRRGGLPTRVLRGRRPRSDVANALLMSLVTGLAVGGWTFAGLRNSPDRPTVQRATSQMLTLMRARTGSAPPAFVGTLLYSRLGLRALEAAVGIVVPFPFAPFLQVHFTKVGRQTSQNLRSWLEEAGAAGLPSDAIASVARRFEVAAGLATEVTPSR